MEYGHKAGGKEHQQCGKSHFFPHGKGFALYGRQHLTGKRYILCQHAAQHQKEQGKQCQRQHGQYEVRWRHAGNRIQIQVLGVADGCQHTAQIGSDGLQYQYGNHFPCQICHLQQQYGKRNECDEGNVIGDHHGKEKAQHHQQQCQLSQTVCPVEQGVGNGFEYA